MAEHVEDLRMDLAGLAAAVTSRWLRIFLVTAGLLAAVAVLLMFVPKTYESSASLLVEARDNAYTRAAGDALQATGASVNGEALMSSQIELVKSRDLLLDVIQSEKLAAIPEFNNPGFSPGSFIQQLIGRKPEPKSLDEVVLANLADHMTVIRERDSSVISVFVRSTDPALAARIANAIAAAHVQRRAAQSVNDTTEATVWLQEQIDKLRTKVATAETAVANYKIANDLFVGSNATPVTDQQLSSVATQISDTQQRKNAAQSRAELIRGLINAGQSLEAVADIRDSVVVQGLLTSKANLQGELAQKSTTLLANHPTIKALKAQIREIENQITAEGRKVASSLEAEAKMEAGLEQKLRDDMTAAKVNSSDATRGDVNLDSLEREAKAQRDLLENYLAKYTDAASRSASNSALPDVRVISEAAAAIDPALPKSALILGAVGFIALALQIGAILFGELMSGRALVARQPYYEAEDVAVAETDDLARWEESAAEEPEAVLPEPVAPPPARPRSDLDLLAASIGSGRVRMLLLAGTSEAADRQAVIDRLMDAAMAAKLSAVSIDAGSGTVSMDLGVTDLSVERADYGDVVHRAGDNLAHVPWGRLAALDRRSVRPMTLLEALSDIYHVVIVDTGAVGVASSLPVFSGATAPVVLVAAAGANPAAAGGARRDVGTLGFDVAALVEAPALHADVA